MSIKRKNEEYYYRKIIQWVKQVIDDESLSDEEKIKILGAVF